MRTITIIARSGNPVDFVVTGKSKLKTNGRTYYQGHFTWDEAATFRFEEKDIRSRLLHDSDWVDADLADDEFEGKDSAEGKADSAEEEDLEVNEG